MTLKAFLLNLYLWVLIVIIFVLFNGQEMLKWDDMAQFGCGFFMLLAVVVSHIVYWKSKP